MKAKYLTVICLAVFSLTIAGMYLLEPTNWFWVLLGIQALSVAAAGQIMFKFDPNDEIGGFKW